MSDLTRTFTINVRPRKHETVDSYSRRLLTANAENDSHRRNLSLQMSDDQTVAGQAAAWLRILELKTGRSDFRFTPHPTAGLDHIDGDGCDRCADTLPPRWMCTLCAKGERIEQNPHFENLVCIHHRRWIGITSTPDLQHPVSDAIVEAALRFDKLRRTHRLDVHLFNALTSAVRETLPSDAMEAESFALTMRLAGTITSVEFTNSLFDPNITFATALSFLEETVRNIVGQAEPGLARAIWLYCLPTFWTVRHSVSTGAPCAPAWPHDLRVPAAAATWKVTHSHLDPFENFYKATSDDLLSVAKFNGRGTQQVVARTVIHNTSRRERELNICNAGHQFAAPPAAKSGWNKGKLATCPLCRHYVIERGINDLWTTHPEIAAEFDEARNNGYTAHDIGSSSNKKWTWLCPKGHNYDASPNNRSSAHSQCPYCTGRKVGFGINDLTTTHPELVAEWHPDWLTYLPPTSLSAGSNRWVNWLCRNGHTFNARVWERAAGKGCPDCFNKRTRDTEHHLALSHPGLAAEWHPTYNQDLRPEHRTAGSHDTVYWQCPKASSHFYRQRIDRRVAGYNCKVCSRRELVPEINDLATTQPVLVREWHPYMNAKQPHKILAGTDKFWWLCEAGKHKYQQSVPHRIQSNGCPECLPQDRILNR
jgi:hypothetical protein